MQDNKTNRDKLYTFLTNKGVTGIGADREEFETIFEDEGKQKKLYDFCVNKGYTGIGKNYDEFAGGFSKKGAHGVVATILEQASGIPYPAPETDKSQYTSVPQSSAEADVQSGGASNVLEQASAGEALKGGENGYTFTGAELGIEEEKPESYTKIGKDYKIEPVVKPQPGKEGILGQSAEEYMTDVQKNLDARKVGMDFEKLRQEQGIRVGRQDVVKDGDRYYTPGGSYDNYLAAGHEADMAKEYNGVPMREITEYYSLDEDKRADYAKSVGRTPEEIEKAYESKEKGDINNQMSDLYRRIDAGIRGVNQKKSALQSQYEKERGVGGFITDALMSGAAAELPVLQGQLPGSALEGSREWQNLDKQEKMLWASARQFNTAQKIINAAKSGDFFTGMGDALQDLVLGGSAQDMQDLAAINEVSRKFEKGEKLTAKEEMLLESIAMNVAVASQYKDELSAWYNAGNMVGEMIPYMVEMWMNPLSKLGKKFGQKVLDRAKEKYKKDLAKHLVSTKIKTGAAKLGGAALGGYGMSLTTGLPSVITGVQERTLGDAVIDKEMSGDVKYAGRKDAEGLGTAIYKETTQKMLDNASEMLGAGYANIPFKWLQKVGKGTKVLGWIDNLANSKFGKGVSQFAEKTKWHGPIEEFLEEVHVGLLNPVLGGDQSWGEFFTADNLATIAIGVAVPGAVISTANTIAGAADGAFKVGAQERWKMKNAEAMGYQLWQDNPNEWNDLTRSLMVGQMEDIEKTLKEVYNNPNLTPEQKKTALEYGVYSLQWRTAKGVEGAFNEGKKFIDPMLRDVYGTAYAEKVSPVQANNAYKAMAEAEKNAQRVLGIGDRSVDEWLGGRSAEEVTNNTARQEAIKAYQAAKLDFEGRRDRYIAEKERAYMESDKSIQANDNNGMVYATQIKNEPVYITGGNVALYEDGTIDANNSSESLYVKFPDGHVEMISPDKFTEVFTSDRTADLKAAKRAEINAKWKAEFDTAEAQAIEQEKREAGTVFDKADSMGVHRIEILNEGEQMSDILIDGKQEQIPTKELNSWKQEAGIQSTDTVADDATDNVAPTGDNVAPVETAAPKTALEQIPRNEKNVPLYEQVDSELAWDGVVEEAGGNEETAMVVVNSMVADKQDALKKAEKAKAKAGVTIAEKIAAENERVANIEKAKADLAKWEEIAGVKAKRAAAQTENVARPVAETAPVVEEVQPIAEATEETQTPVVETPQAAQERQNMELVDNQGNPIDENGRLIVEEVATIDDITDADFDTPVRNVQLPVLPGNVATAIGTNGKPVVIKKNVFEKNGNTHVELEPADSREILKSALYNPNVVGAAQPIKRPDYKVAIRTGEKNAVVVLDVFQGKDHVEIVGWRQVNEKGLAKMQRQAEREGGQFLILSPNDGSAAALSALPFGLSSESKSTTQSANKQENRQENAGNSTLKQIKAELKDLRKKIAVNGNKLRRMLHISKYEQLTADLRDMNSLLTTVTTEQAKEEYGIDINKWDEVKYDALWAERDQLKQQIKAAEERLKNAESATDDVQGGGQNGVAQEEAISEPVGNSEQLSSSEIPNNQSVAEGDAPGQSGVRNVRDWLTPENLDWAENKTLKEIIEKFGNALEPIARIPEKVMRLLGIKDGYIYSGKGYFIDHAVNHHPEVTLEEYDNIQSIISDYDDIKDLSTDKVKKVAFIKKLDKGYAVVAEISEENGKVLLHKTFFYKDSNSNRIPYKNKPSLLKESPADGSTTISPEDNNQQPADTENISALDASSAAKIVENFENPTVESKNLIRSGSGPLTDREVVMESDIYSKVLGKPRYYGQKQRNYVARQRAKMAQKATELAEKLNTSIEVRETAEGLTGKKAKAKGWYDVKSGNIVVVVSNHGSIEDIQATVLHEVVAHKGLRQMFGEHFDTFLDNVYNNVDAEIRAEIDALTEKYGNTREATEEYLASLAENTYFEKVNPSLWSRIKQWFLNMLTEAGIKLDFELSDNELRYILWRSHQRLVNPGIYNPVTRITDVAVRARLGIGEYAPAIEEMSHAAEEDAAEYANKNQDVFVSNAQRAVEGIQQNKATAEQWIAMLKKSGGLKTGEDAWLGLEEWLNEKQGTVTKQEILDFIGENKIQIEEVEYAGGGEQMENYRGLLEKSKGKAFTDRFLRAFDIEYDEFGIFDEQEAIDLYNEANGTDMQLDKDGYWNDGDDIQTIIDWAESVLKDARGDVREIHRTRIQYTTEGLENKREIALVVPTVESYNIGDYTHFGDAGNGRAVAWVRFGETTDSEGNRVLVIDEIQSKRHQDAREKGYKTKEDEEIINKQGRAIWEMMQKYNVSRPADLPNVISPEDAVYIEELKSKKIGEVPTAPFEKNWHELAMKRMLRLAAEEGFDKVAWTTGEQQAQRYNLSNSVSRIDVELDGRKTPKNTNLYDVYTYDTQGDVIDAASGPMNEERLSEVFGKEIAISIAKGVQNSANGKTSISGDGLRIGGEGMKGFYDRMLPSFVQKYTKKWGAKVGEVTMPNLGENNVMHSVDVTPEMQESVMEGQTMFRITPEMDAEYMDAVEEGDISYDEAVHEAKIFEETHKGSAPIIVLDGIDNWESEFIKAGVKKDEIERFRERLKRSSGNPKAVYLDDADLILIFSPKVARKEFNGYIWHEDMHKAIREDDRFNRDIAERIINTVVPGGYQEVIEYLNKHGYEGLAADEEALCQILQSFYINGAVGRKGVKGKGVIQDYFNPLIDKVYGQRDGRNSNLGDRSVQSATHGTDETEYDGRTLATPVEQKTGRESETETQATGGAEETRFRRVEETSDGSIDDVPTQPLTLMERITNSLLEVSAKNKENFGLRADALKAFGKDINRVLSAMKAQREYDKFTVDTLVKLAKMYFKNAQLLGEVAPYTMGRVLSLINNVVGKRDVAASAAKLMDILLDAHTNALAGILEKAEKVKAKKVNAAGVEVMGRLDKYGQISVDEYKTGKEMTSEKLEEAIYDSDNRLAELEQRVREALGLPEGDVDQAARDYTGDNDVVDVYLDERARLEGLMLARDYKESVQHNLDEIKDLEQELKKANQDYRLGNIDSDSLKEFRKSASEAILQSKAELIEGYHDLIYKFQEGVKKSSQRANAFVQAQIDRAREIQHNANSDMEGIEADSQGKHPERFNNSVTRTLMSPMPTFQGMLKKFGEKNVEGKGYLYERFMPQATKASDNEFRGKVAARVMIETKLKEIYGGDMDLGKFMKSLREPGITVTYREGNKMKEFELTQGQMLYIYMVNKMSDGQMKLRRMGITDDVVAELMTKLPEDTIRFADWVQNELLKDLRGKYNAVHERVFGAPMAAIDNYFPIKIRKEARGEKGDVSEIGQEGKPSTITGSIIKRTKNAIAIDLSADAMQVLMEHIDDMEHWAAFAEFNRDINTLLNYRHFQNQVKNDREAVIARLHSKWSLASASGLRTGQPCNLTRNKIKLKCYICEQI